MKEALFNAGAFFTYFNSFKHWFIIFQDVLNVYENL